MEKKYNEFKSISYIVIFMIVVLASLYIILLFIPEGRVYDISIAMLPALPSVILILVTMMYVKTTYNLLNESKKDTIIRDLRAKLKNFYTPLNSRYFIDKVVSNREQIFFNHLNTKDYKEYYMHRLEKESFEKLIGDNLHFADDDLEKGLNEIRYSTNDFTIPRERCNEIANLIKNGYEKYKKEYEELTLPTSASNQA